MSDSTPFHFEDLIDRMLLLVTLNSTLVHFLLSSQVEGSIDPDRVDSLTQGLLRTRKWMEEATTMKGIPPSTQNILSLIVKRLSQVESLLPKLSDKAKQAEQKEMLRKFASPKPFTINSIYMKKALVKQKVKFAMVGIKDKISKGTPAGEYLKAQIEGGKRKIKPFEFAMKVHGRKRLFKPSRIEKLNRYGNMPRARLKKIVKFINGERAVNVRKVKGAYKGYNKFFSKLVGNYAVIYEKYGRGYRKIKPVLVETGGGGYTKRFDFYATGKKAVDQNFDKEMNKAMIQAFSG